MIRPPQTSQIWKNIVINESQRGGKRVGGIVMRVGVRGGALSKVERTAATGGAGFRYKQGTGKYVQVKKFGKIKKHVTHPGGDTRSLALRRTGQRAASMPARPFMRPALENNIGKVIDELAEGVGRADRQDGNSAATEAVSPCTRRSISCA